MDIARPAGGFIIREKEQIEACLKENEKAWPRLRQQWRDLKDRLKMTAHREGTQVTEPGWRVFEAQGSIENKVPAIRVAYHVLGDTLTLMKIQVIDPPE